MNFEQTIEVLGRELQGWSRKFQSRFQAFQRRFENL